MSRPSVVNAVTPSDAVVSVPAQLGAIDGAIIRCIAGEVSKKSLAWETRRAGVDAQQRLDRLMSRHLNMTYGDLHVLSGSERMRLANYIVAAELEERDTMPGALAPLRTYGPSTAAG